jgi:hypothetical protein
MKVIEIADRPFLHGRYGIATLYLVTAIPSFAIRASHSQINVNTIGRICYAVINGAYVRQQLGTIGKVKRTSANSLFPPVRQFNIPGHVDAPPLLRLANTTGSLSDVFLSRSLPESDVA